jgi:hypothetical protein
MTYVTCGIYGIPQVTYVIRRLRCVARRPNLSGEVGHSTRGNDGSGRLLKIKNEINKKGLMTYVTCGIP